VNSRKTWCGLEAKTTQYLASGDRLKRLREAKGISRAELAVILKVDVSSIAGWEGGNRLPRERRRRSLARVLGVDLETLFKLNIDTHPALTTATLVDTVSVLPDLLIDLTQRTSTRIRALRLAAPYVTPAHVQIEWRNLVDRRIRDGTLEVERIEIFYDLRRLQEILSNIIRYDGRPYLVMSFCAGISEVVPAFGGYFFDEEEFLLGAYWTGVPPRDRPGIRLSGPPFQRFFHDYWNEIWRRGTLLNIRGAHDLTTVRDVALKLGLVEGDWDRFVEEAKRLDIEDGAPPLI